MILWDNQRRRQIRSPEPSYAPITISVAERANDAMSSAVRFSIVRRILMLELTASAKCHESGNRMVDCSRCSKLSTK